MLKNGKYPGWRKDWETIFYNLTNFRWWRNILYRQIFKIKSNKGKNILNYDWDYLIIIDACRHDLFEEIYGETNSISSVGSSTGEWFNNTFENKNYDLIYISGNPVVSKPSQERLGEGKISFFKLEPVWDYGWNGELKTVPPEEVTERALELIKEYPNKRMIIHYLQPHHPFINEHRIIRSGVEGAVMKNKGMKRYGVKETPWRLLEKGQIEEEEVWRAYRSNLKLVMKEVEKLRENLNGKTILTSDHGNCKGEHGVYGHPRGLKFKELVKVPWVVLGIRKTGEKEEVVGKIDI